MSNVRKLIVLALFVLPQCLLAAEVSAQSPQAVIVQNATNVLNEIMAVPAKQIPQSMLADAHGIAIIPNVVKGGFVVGLRYGKGVVVIRGANGAWDAPVFITLTGGSVGWQAGLQATDVILVFKTQKSVQGLMEGKFTIGTDAAVAAGPVGRQAAAATDTRLGAEIYSYSRSRGLFAGVALDGSVLQVDAAANRAYYHRTSATPDTAAQLPPTAVALLETIARYASSRTAPAATVTEAAPIAGSPAMASAPTELAPRPVEVPAGAANTNRRVVSDELATASQKLSLLLDDNWKRFLAMPSAVYTGGAAPPVAAMNDVLKRFETVARSPQYTALTQRAEFRETYSLLQDYIKQLSAPPQGGLRLPPPPEQTGNAPQPTRRY